MQASEFYDYFKQGLEALGVSWNEKEMVDVTFADGSFHMTVDGRTSWSVQEGNPRRDQAKSDG